MRLYFSGFETATPVDGPAELRLPAFDFASAKPDLLSPCERWPNDKAPFARSAEITNCPSVRWGSTQGSQPEGFFRGLLIGLPLARAMWAAIAALASAILA
jgi:hypothetical protein